jgi:hypothetical protein
LFSLSVELALYLSELVASMRDQNHSVVGRDSGLVVVDG